MRFQSPCEATGSRNLSNQLILQQEPKSFNLLAKQRGRTTKHKRALALTALEVSISFRSNKVAQPLPFFAALNGVSEGVFLFPYEICFHFTIFFPACQSLFSIFL